MASPKSTALISKGGRFIIQDNSKKGLEATYLALFTCTEEGKEWLTKNKISTKISNESPDFTFETSNGKTIGLEIVNFIFKSTKYHANKHDVTSKLITISNQICQHFKKEKDIALSLLIDFWDKRKWCARTYKEMMEASYDPGFRHLEATNKEIKEALINSISQLDIKPNGLEKTHIEIGSQIFNITVTRWDEPHTSVHINNAGIVKEDPFEELQTLINTKNKKYETYKKKCKECYLLVVSDDSSTGNFCSFSNKTKSHKFISTFKNVYLLNLGFDTKIIKLKTSKS